MHVRRRKPKSTPLLDEIGEIDPPPPSDFDLEDVPLLDEMEERALTNTSLTPRDELLCQFYLERPDIEYAASRTGISVREASIRLRLKCVQKYCKELSKARAERFNISQDKILAELARLAFADPREIAEWDENGIRLKPSHLIPEHAARAIQSISISKSRSSSDSGGSESSTINVKFHDKQKAIDLLGKHLGMFADKVEIGGSLKLDDLLMYTKEIPNTIEGERSQDGEAKDVTLYEPPEPPPETPEDALIRALNEQLNDLDKEDGNG